MIASLLAEVEEIETKVRAEIAAGKKNIRIELPPQDKKYSELVVPVLIGTFDAEGWDTIYESDDPSVTEGKEWLILESLDK